MGVADFEDIFEESHRLNGDRPFLYDPSNSLTA
jgi:hypothetical protein